MHIQFLPLFQMSETPMEGGDRDSGSGRGGIGKFVVPKFTIPTPAQENRLWTGSTPGHCKTGKEGTDRPIAGMERASRRDTLGRKVGS